ncbi:hypothetical protein [Novosphingobium sp. MD-1]|uniref:hypothetical protein n=1 Tax=Novosphingobium sp. MD-1 TaxID=1630648 RepID=UPI00061BA72E|nr:hypothetical protein [Novosphingobium sp. MD-1]GAO54897.1 hypothetical protein NMD1_01999 [Novosphingobium sp. MD-1]
MTGRVDGKGKKRGLRRILRAPLLIGAAASAGLLIAPTVSSAFASHFDASPVSLAARGGIGSFTPASIDPRLAAQITVRALSNGKLFRFTPAGTETRPDRAVTVAVRVNDDTSRVVSVRQAFAAAATTLGAATVRIAPTAYNLGLARGYQSFAIDGSQPREAARLEMPDFQAFKLSGPAPTAPGRLSPRLELDQKERAGRAPRTLENQGDYQVDLGGSYRLTGNLNVMAGIRYSSERDRLRPLTDGKQDSQAVYVGTQFHF